MRIVLILTLTVFLAGEQFRIITCWMYTGRIASTLSPSIQTAMREIDSLIISRACSELDFFQSRGAVKKAAAAPQNPGFGDTVQTSSPETGS